MPTLGNIKVNSYRAGVITQSNSPFSRFIMLQLATDPPQIIYLYFGNSPLPDGKFYPFYSWELWLGLSLYDDILHLLQTESPVYFSGYFEDKHKKKGMTPVNKEVNQYFKLISGHELPGEGPSDADHNKLNGGTFAEFGQSLHRLSSLLP